MVVVTHAHIDHCGLLPRLVRQGFEGVIHATQPTVDLLDIMLKDAAHIQMEDVKYKKKRHRKQGKKSKFPYEPLYNDRDAVNALRSLNGIRYDTKTEIAPNVEVTFQDAGHILGSSSLQFSIRLENGERRELVFSGDIGQCGKPLIRDPSPFEFADYLVMESTYGDRNHREAGDVNVQLEEIAGRTLRRGGKVIIPTFAVERAQELMYHFGGLVHDGKLPEVPIFLDSPMAVNVTETFHKHRDSYDEETWERISEGVPPLRFPGLQLVRDTKDSMKINTLKGPAVIMSTSGMCTAGRIKHHLKNHIEDPKNTVLFVGYQGRGTLGRIISDGKNPVRIHGREYEVKADIERIYGFSGHADRDDLLKWASAIKTPPRQTFLTHGDEDSAFSLAEALRKNEWKVEVPEYQQTVDLI